MTQANNEQATAEDRRDCPFCAFMDFLDDAKGSETASHFRKAREEVLLGIRALIDERIDSLKKKEKDRGKRVTKIKVE